MSRYVCQRRRSDWCDGESMMKARREVIWQLELRGGAVHYEPPGGVCDLFALGEDSGPEWPCGAHRACFTGDVDERALPIFPAALDCEVSR